MWFCRHCCPVAQFPFNVTVITDVLILSFKIAFPYGFAFSKILLLLKELKTVGLSSFKHESHCHFNVVATDVM